MHSSVKKKKLFLFFKKPWCRVHPPGSISANESIFVLLCMQLRHCAFRCSLSACVHTQCSLWTDVNRRVNIVGIIIVMTRASLNCLWQCEFVAIRVWCQKGFARTLNSPNWHLRRTLSPTTAAKMSQLFFPLGVTLNYVRLSGCNVSRPKHFCLMHIHHGEQFSQCCLLNCPGHVFILQPTQFHNKVVSPVLFSNWIFFLSFINQTPQHSFLPRHE